MLARRGGPGEGHDVRRAIADDQAVMRPDDVIAGPVAVLLVEAEGLRAFLARVDLGNLVRLALDGQGDRLGGNQGSRVAWVSSGSLSLCS